jgi:hypothetical protein
MTSVYDPEASRQIAMRVQTRDRDALSRLSFVDVRAYLASRGWIVKGRYGSVATIHSMTTADGREIELLLPSREGLGDYAARMGDVVEVLSEVEGRDQLSVFTDLAHVDASAVSALCDR